MATAAFLSGLDIESGIKHLDPIHQKSIPSTGPSPSPLELDQLEWGVAYTGPSTPEALAGTINPIDQSSGIQSNLNSPAAIEDRYQVQTAQDQTEIAFAQRWSYFSNKWRVLTCCVLYLADGMSDSAPGALLPYMEKHYSIGYAVVSLIFVSQAAGFLAAAFITDTLKTRLGLAKTYSLSQFVMVTAFAMIIATPPFPVVVFSFFLNGWAMSINIALSNVFCANLANSTVILAAAQGAYGIGGTIGPIIATSLVSRGVIWSRYYIITLITCVFGAVASGWSFRYYETEYGVHLTSTLEREAGRQVEVNASRSSKRSLLIQALKYGVTLIGALFTFGYQGAEVSISGWVISFLITERQGNPKKVGYVTAGFWGGITLGRFTLCQLALRFGEKRFIFGLGLAAVAFQLLVWLIPNVIGDTIAVVLVGYVLGPIAPISMVMFVRLLPRSIHTLSVSFISSAGSLGGALWPFFTGLIAQSKGTFVLHPICIGLFALMIGCWVMLPKVDERKE